MNTINEDGKLNECDDESEEWIMRPYLKSAIFNYALLSAAETIIFMYPRLT